MGATDSAQTTDLVGLYLLHELALEFPELEGGAYRDDLLCIVKNKSTNQVERLKKQIRTFYKSYNMGIIFEPSVKVANFLDVTLRLNANDYKPFHKKNENLRYVNKKSNHPKAVIKSIVNSVSHRISKLSANISVFEQNAQYYNEALNKSTQKQNRRNKVTYFLCGFSA